MNYQMNYYLKYIKYKIKYLNLLGKTKRKLQEIGFTESSDIKKNDLDEQSEKIEENKNDEYEIQRKTKLSSLFNLFTTEKIFIPIHIPIPHLNPNHHLHENILEFEGTKKNKSNPYIHQYDLRPRNPNINYASTWTPELIKNLN